MRHTILILFLLALLPCLPGCDSAGQDIADFFGGIFPPSPGEAARMALDPHDPDLRREGTLLLANAPFGGNEPYPRMYRDYVETDDNPLVKAVAVRALARHGTPEDALLIAQQLEDENLQVRWEAAKGLQRLHNPEVVTYLLGVLRRYEEHSEVRVAVANALGQYPEDRVVQGLVAALDARELEVNVAALESLTLLTGQTLGLDPRAWLNWYDLNVDQSFAGQLEYRYPTYRRDESWLERLAFWSSRSYEQPAPPTGLDPRDERRTYEDSDQDEDGDDGEARDESAGGDADS